MPSTFIGPEGLDELGIGSPRAIKSGSLLQPYPLNSIADPTPTDNVVWDGGGADNNWMTHENWINPEIQPNPDDVLHFAGTTRLTPNNDYPAASAFAGIEFDASAGAFTLGGNSVTLNGDILNESTNNQVINNNIIINSVCNVSSTNLSCGETRLNGDISGTGGLTISSANTSQFVLVYGNNSFTGPLTMSDCYCVFDTFANGGVPCALGAQSSNPANIVLVNDVIDVFFQYTGPTVSTDRGMTVTGAYGSGVFSINTAGTVVTFNGLIIGDAILQVQSDDFATCAAIFTGANTIPSIEPGYDGQVKFSSVADIGTPCNIGIGTEMSAGIYSNGALEYTGPTTSTNKVLSGSGTFRVASSGVLTLTGTGTHTGVIEINSGTLRFGSGGATGSSLSSSGIVNNSALVYNRTGTFVYSGIISGTGTVTKSGASVLTLDGANSFQGGFTLNAGTLNINHATAIGTGTFTIAGGTIDNTTGGVITLTNNNAQTWSADFTFTGTNTLNTGAGTITLSANRQVTVAGSSLQIGGAIVGAFTLTKDGAGTLVFAGANTYSGPTTVSAGLLQVGLGGTAGSLTSDVSVSLGASLGFNRSDSYTYDGVISGAGTLAKVSAGTIVLTATNTITGTTVISGGTLQITGSLASASVSVSGGTLLGRSVTGASATLSGTVTVSNSTSSILQPGSFGDNILNTGALTFSGSSARLTVNSTTTTMSKVNVTGTVALGGCGIILPAGITTGGTYKVITASSTMNGTLPTIVTNNTGRYCLVQQTANDLEVIVGWTPAEIATAGWWDATDAATITQIGGAVSQWDDKSGNARHVTQSTAAAKPTTGTRTINSLNVLDFDGGDFMENAADAAALLPDGTDVYIFVVTQLDKITDMNMLVHWKDGVAGQEAGGVYDGGGDASSILEANVASTTNTMKSIEQDGANANLANAIGTLTFATTDTLLVAAQIDRSSANPKTTMWRAGTQDATATGAGAKSSLAATCFHIGAHGSTDTNLARWTDGVIGEVIIVHGISAATRQKIEGYLAWKWSGL